ncbi:tRNA (adenosine(37)-N6)-threonylcarbamoyltransferase complex ATPase subunit type 1 TsaE [Hyphomonas sp. WL0036]|uniref:tRNA (adenosine(37)-N6)-threonylcarbamoyltransferase complex ATPase subunit type 1 TsaE n=1 Tax=Hyphomonas sediminis TaxID=2866160 RepID=UPI001C80172E|nr:tRNA (adenosine(37)-N6)-threonylcarbamoyltransferase complex ATPase subunit type 1 TsaE [Hyphomonas sediminis]MBY9067706.1 tRNA (adenosine(37)-N6)-threonylcarbamoyltransferase complex ATPase subunit type 1 TsaE [Hyphomonas sediminis]
MGQTFELAAEADTLRMGQALAGLLRAGDFVALHGDLGAGKTTLSRGLVQAILGSGDEVTSPTYTLVQVYEGPDFPVWHYDLYRLDDPEGVVELGWDETIDGVALVEWPDRAGRHLPATRLDVFLEITGDHRRLRLEPKGEGWQERLHGLSL